MANVELSPHNATNHAVAACDSPFSKRDVRNSRGFDGYPIMAETFHQAEVNKSRKQRQCSWCARLIEVGDPYKGYSFKGGSDFGRVEMHPECYSAMQQVAFEEGGWFDWSAGDFHRGCGCASGDCKCSD